MPRLSYIGRASGEALADALKAAVKFTWSDIATRPTLAAVSIDVLEGRIVVVATDTFRLARVTVQGSQGDDLDELSRGRVLLSRAVIPEWVREWRSHPEPLGLEHDALNGGLVIRSSLGNEWREACVLGEFPNWRRLMTDFPQAGRLSLDLAEMKRVFADMSRVRSEKLRFDMDAKEVLIRYRGTPKDDPEEERVERPLSQAIWFPTEKPQWTVTVNPKFLRSMMELAPGAAIEVPVVDSWDHVKPVQVGAPGRLALLMPIREEGSSVYQPRTSRRKGVGAKKRTAS